MPSAEGSAALTPRGPVPSAEGLAALTPRGPVPNAAGPAALTPRGPVPSAEGPGTLTPRGPVPRVVIQQNLHSGRPYLPVPHSSSIPVAPAVPHYGSSSSIEPPTQIAQATYNPTSNARTYKKSPSGPQTETPRTAVPFNS